MSRVYWDSMLFIYLLEERPGYFKKVKRIHQAMLRRGDVLCTSVFAFGEVLTGLRKQKDEAGIRGVKEFMLSDEVIILPFDLDAADRYSLIRAETRVSQADAIHLATAAASGVDVFITNDDKLRTLAIPGIRFFADLDGQGDLSRSPYRQHTHPASPAARILVEPPMPVKAIYPGTFDPPTNGHLDLIERGSKIFDHLIVAILSNSAKDPLFTVEERAEMLKEITAGIDNVSVATFNGLMVEFARQQGASAVLRGIRAISDYEFEFQMALMNRRLAPEIETVFLQPAGRYSFVSSRLVKEVFSLGGDVTGLLPPNVLKRLRARLNNGN